MKTFIVRLVCFIPFMLVMYLVLVFCWGRHVNRLLTPNLKYFRGVYGHTYSRLQEVKTTKNVDILFLGSSHAYRGFDTRIFDKHGYKTFNLGSSAQTPIQTKLLVGRYLDKLQPKLVVYEVYPETFSNDGIESSLDIFSNDYVDIESARMAIAQNHVKSYNTLLYAYMAQEMGLNDEYKEPVLKGKDLYIKGGYVERKISYFKHKQYSKRKWKLLPQQLRYFNDIIEVLKKRKIEFILIQAPITGNLYKSYTNNNYFDSLMSTRGAYYNFNQMMQLDDSLHFYDGTHLNQDGVELFNKKFIEVLEND